MRLIFMGTPDFAVPTLQALIDAPEYEVVAVYSQPPRPAGRGQKLTPSPVQQLAEAHSIPVHTPITLKTPEAQAIFAAHGADAAIVAAYGLLLPQAILDAPRFGCINLHPSDLPRWRGAAPLQRTIMAGDRHTAMCIMQMEAGLDTGPVLHREPVSLEQGTTAGELHDLMSALGAKCLLQVLREVASGTTRATPQSEEGVTYAAKITKAEAEIDWQDTAESLQHKILGLNPAPGAWFLHQGEAIKVLRAAPTKGSAAPGTVLDPTGIIACGTGALRLLEIQRPGKKAMRIEEALRGGWKL